MPTNNYLPFCPTDTSTNLLTQAEYLASSGRTDGNQPGVASSKLNNKAIRQSSFVTSQFAQFLSDFLGVDVLDDGVTATLLAKIKAGVQPVNPTVQKFTSGSGTYNLSYVFTITSGSATTGATYTNNAVTFTVSATVASATRVVMTGGSAPLASGTLTKSGGTGDSTLTFQAVRTPIYLRVQAVGGGGGGSGSGTASNGNGTSGANTTFGTVLIVAGGGAFGSADSSLGGVGGTASLGTAVGTAVVGGVGTPAQPSIVTLASRGGDGASSFFGGNGAGGLFDAAGIAAAANSGGGGGGAGVQAVASGTSGAGGGSGGYVEGIITSPSATYSYAVGAAGAAGGAGTSGKAGAAGGSGVIIVTEYYQ